MQDSGMSGTLTNHFYNLGFPLRSHVENLRLATEYRNLRTDKERSDFHKEHGIRWSEFFRLPYFDAIQMGIIDPMHNVLLGTVVFTSGLCCSDITHIIIYLS